MNNRYRRTVIAGNWKMNKTATETKKYAAAIKPVLPRRNQTEVILCVPTCNLYIAARAFRDARVSIGAENMYCEDCGAYTGEVSGPMLRDLGVKYVILGHSERRALFGETDAMVNKKVHAALKSGLHPIICVGETAEERAMGITAERIALQLKAAIAGVGTEKIRKCIIAYEPIWAIGTGKTATAKDAEEVCRQIRAILRKMYGARISRAVVILYGGSMNESNAVDLLRENDIDGGLVGGASLVPEKFVKIIAAPGEVE